MSDQPSKGIADILVTQLLVGAFGGTSNYSVFVSKEPSLPINVFTIYDLQGTPFNCSSGLVTKYHECQIRLRVSSGLYPSAMDRLDAIVNYLAFCAPVTQGGFVYDEIIITKLPSKIGVDENENDILTMEIRLTREEVLT